MDIDLTLKNYRCFEQSHPVSIRLRKGFTALIGINNSGKSSLLKFMYEFRPLFALLSGPNGNLLNALRRSPEGLSVKVADTSEILCNINNQRLEIGISLVDAKGAAESGVGSTVTRLTVIVDRATMNWTAALDVPNIEALVRDSRGFRGQQLLNNTGQPALDFSGIFAAFDMLKNAFYIGPFRNAINLGTNDDYYDIQVGQAFIQRWRVLKTGTSLAQNEATFRLTQAIKDIFGFEDLEINPSSDDTTLQYFVNGRSYTASNLGAGLTQFVLTLANAAVKSPSYILIDEPELNLHPALQTKFLTALGSYASEGCVFATHNLGLARTSAQYIYSFRTLPTGMAEVRPFESTPRLSEFLGEISFDGYREIGFDRLLFVEGPTDVLTIQQFLRLYNKDQRVVLLHLGGSSLINDKYADQLQEIKRISDRISVLIDSERENPGSLNSKRQAFVDTCTAANIPCHVLERRAIENYLSVGAIQKIKSDKYRALEPYEKLEQVSPAWAKHENWKIAREMTKQELDGTDLGDFLTKL